VNPVVVGLVTAVTVVGVMLTGSFIYWSIRARRADRARSLAHRLGTLAKESEPGDIFQLREADPIADALGFVGRHLEQLVRQANAGYPVSGLALRIVLTSLGGALVLGTLAGTGGAILGLGSGVVPYMMVKAQARARMEAISEQLPDALDLISRSLQAGHGVADAFRLVAEEMPLPIARELGEVYEQHNLGRDFRECMTELAARNPHNFDLKIFVSAVLLQRETGGNLIEVLDNIAATVRARFVFQAKVKSLTAEARMSSIILGALPFVVGGAIAWLRPGYLDVLVVDPMGQRMLVVCGMLFLSGVLLMRSLARVEA